MDIRWRVSNKTKISGRLNPKYKHIRSKIVVDRPCTLREYNASQSTFDYFFLAVEDGVRYDLLMLRTELWLGPEAWPSPFEGWGGG